MKATKIKMKPGCSNSTKTTEIDQIYIEGCTNPGYFKKATLYDYLKSNPNSIWMTSVITLNTPLKNLFGKN